MDNGQHGIVVKPSDGFKNPDEGFFTPGVGNSPAEANDVQPENNLDEENWQQALNISKPLDMPSPSKIAEAVKIAESVNATEAANIQPPTPEQPANIPKLPDFKPPENNAPELGQITTIENSINLPEVKKQQGYNPNNIKTTGDKLERSSIAEVDSAITELNQTGNLSNFYEEIRSMTEVNLNNSFNRKLYQDNPGGDK